MNTLPTGRTLLVAHFTLPHYRGLLFVFRTLSLRSIHIRSTVAGHLYSGGARPPRKAVYCRCKAGQTGQ